jgi:hypothetical protein
MIYFILFYFINFICYSMSLFDQQVHVNLL